MDVSKGLELTLIWVLSALHFIFLSFNVAPCVEFMFLWNLLLLLFWENNLLSYPLGSSEVLYTKWKPTWLCRCMYGSNLGVETQCDYLSSESHRLMIPDEVVNLRKWTMDNCGNNQSLPR